MPSLASFPPDRPHRSLYRLAHRLAAGMPKARAAAAEGLTTDRLDAILAKPGFAAAVDQCRALRDLPTEARLARIETMALDALEHACACGDVRAIICFLALRRTGLNPACVLAER